MYVFMFLICLILEFKVQLNFLFARFLVKMHFMFDFRFTGVIFWFIVYYLEQFCSKLSFTKRFIADKNNNEKHLLHFGVWLQKFENNRQVKQGRIHGNPVADGCAEAVMGKPLAILEIFVTDGRTDRHGKV